MITYTKEELLPSSAVSKNFGSVLDKLRKKKLNKIAVMRNNKMEAVILPISEYENLMDIADVNEHLELYQILKKRDGNSIKNAIPLKKILTEYGIKEDEL